MSTNWHKNLKVAKEDILRAIAEFQTSSIEEIKQDSGNLEYFTIALDQLVEEGLVTLSNGSVRLTPTGEDYAGAVTSRHRAIEKYFVHELDPHDTHRVAHTLEHIIVEEVVHALKEIRALEGKGVPLSGEDPREGVITRLDSTDSHLFHRMISMGICPGQWIRTIKKIPGGLVVLVGNIELAIGWEIASQIEVMYP